MTAEIRRIAMRECPFSRCTHYFPTLNSAPEYSSSAALNFFSSKTSESGVDILGSGHEEGLFVSTTL